MVPEVYPFDPVENVSCIFNIDFVCKSLDNFLLFATDMWIYLILLDVGPTDRSWGLRSQELIRSQDVLAMPICCVSRDLAVSGTLCFKVPQCSVPESFAIMIVNITS